jgi:predicted  nucleic acid-binding Zn-ribbon protein
MLLLEWLFRSINRKLEAIMATQQELAAALTTANQQLTDIGTEVDKIGTEVTGLEKQVADLTAALGNVQTTPEVDAALTALQATTASLASRVQTVDNLVPDAPVTP